MTQKPWAKRYSQCRYCKRKDIPHRCRGLCSPCYIFMWKYVGGKKKKSNDALAISFRKIFFEHIIGQ